MRSQLANHSLATPSSQSHVPFAIPSTFVDDDLGQDVHKSHTLRLEKAGHFVQIIQ